MLFSRRFDADVEYVDNLSFSLDVSILARTLGATLRGKNITMGADLKALDDVGITRDLPAHYFNKPNAKSAGSDADQ